MCQFIETLRIEKGVACNIDYHNRRMNATRTTFWKNCQSLNLSDYIHYEGKEECIKCRVIYQDVIKEITYAPYQIRPVHSLQIIHDDTLSYTYKSTERGDINALFAQRNLQDDILIVKKGRITDSSIANVALFDGIGWYTPQYPILHGTKRAELLDKGIIRERDIRLDHLFHYSYITLFNAMIDFGKIQIVITPQTITV